MKFKLLLFAIIVFAKSNAQIPNSDFEYWEPTDSVEMPLGWSVTSNLVGIPYAIEEIKDTDSYSGDYCLRLPRSSTATITARSKFSLDFHPQTLHGFFKPDISNKDTFWIKISLYSLGQTVDSGQWFYAGYAIPYYSPFSIPISQNGASVDSAAIEIIYDKNNPNTTYYYVNVDQLFFDDNSGIFSPPISENLQITPNPSASLINISNLPSIINHFEITIINQLGQQFDLGTISRTDLATLDISFLSEGIYEMVLRDRHEIRTGKFVKQ